MAGWKMKLVSVLLLVISLSFANSFGYSRLTIERTWAVESDKAFELTGALAVNNSNQKVVSVSLTPGAEFYTDDEGTIWVRYSGEGDSVITATAIVDVSYDTNITSDPPLPSGPLPAPALTEADQEMAAQAKALAREDSSLFTIRNLVNWVHDYVTYDSGYWGEVKSAEDVYRERRGVCVEYSHLLISLARSLGFETRYVSGYVFSEGWQPHAWAEIEVPGYGWLPADPTFGQAGILDNTHLAIHKGEDQTTIYDSLVSRDMGAEIQVSDRVVMGFSDNDPKGAGVVLDSEEDTYVAEVTIRNMRDDYVFGSYSFNAPSEYGGGNSTLLLLRPDESLRIYHGLNRSLFSENYLYTIPFSASFNDARDSETLTINGITERKEGDPEFFYSFCIPAIVVFIIVVAITRI